MQLLAKKILKNRRGMTLIEIMIVLAIIGSLIAILANRIGGQQEKAKVRETRIQMSQIVTAIQMYYTDCGKYPQTLEGLSKADPACQNWGPEPYYKFKKGESSLKDSWNHDFVYTLTAGEFTLKSLGKDGAEGGTGYDADLTNDD